MTVRLLRPFNGLPVDTIVTLDRATEAALVSLSSAVNNPTQGIPYVPNPPFDQTVLRLGLPLPAESLGAATTNTPEGNRAALQAALDMNNDVTLLTDGDFEIDDLLFVDSNRTIQLGANTRIRNVGAIGKALLKTTNAHWDTNTFWNPGTLILCATQGTPAGTGTMRRSGNTLFYTAPGDTEGVGVAITVGPANGSGTARYELPSGNSAWNLHVVVSQPTMGGTTFPIRIHNSSGSKPVTWSRTSNITTITEPGHGREALDSIVMCGTNFIGQAFIRTVIDANTYTIADSRGNATGSGEVFGRRNINILGGTWDGNMAVRTDNRGFEDRHVMLVPGVTNLTIQCRVTESIKYGIFAQGNSNIHVDIDFYASNPVGSTAAFQSDGHSLNTYVTVRGRSTDTMIAFIGGEFPAQGCWLLSTNEGNLNFYNTTVENVISDNSLFELIRVALASGGLALNTRIRNIKGSIDTARQQMSAVGVIYDTLLHNPGAYSIVDFDCEDVRVDNNGPNHLAQVTCVVHGATASRGIKIRNIVATSNNVASGDAFVIVGSPAGVNCAIDDVEVNGFRHSNGTWQGRAVITQGTGAIKLMTVRNVGVVVDNALVNTTFASGCFTHESAITIQRCLLDECSMEDVSAAGTKSDVWRCWTSGGVIDSFVITRMKCLGTLSLGEYNSTATGTNITMQDVDVRSAATIFGIRMSRVAASVTVGDIRSFGTILTDLVRISYSSANMTIRSTGNLYTPSGGSGRHVNLAGGGTNAPTCYGFDLWADETQLTTTRGQYVKTTAAGNAVLYRNAGAWAEIG